MGLRLMRHCHRRFGGIDAGDGAAPGVETVMTSSVGAAAVLAAGMSTLPLAATAAEAADAVLKNASRSASSIQWTAPLSSVIRGICSQNVKSEVLARVHK